MSLQRYRLVAADEVDRLRDQQLLTREPNLRAANRFDQAIRELLEDKSKSSNEVSRELEALMLQLKNVLGTARDVAGAAKRGSVVPVPGAAAAAVVAEPERDTTIEQALGSVPMRQKDHARQALEHLKEESITFDKDMHLVIEGEPVKGSNVVDLMHAMFTPSLQKLPKHSESFARALHAANFPTSYVPNRMVKELMRSRSPSPPPSHLKSAALASSSFTTTPASSSNVPTSGNRRNKYKKEGKQSGFGFAALASLMRPRKRGSKRKAPTKRPTMPSKKRVFHLYP